MRRIRFSLLIVLAVLCLGGSAFAQDIDRNDARPPSTTEPEEEDDATDTTGTDTAGTDGGAVDPATGEPLPRTANPVRPGVTENAHFTRQGWIELDGGLNLVIQEDANAQYLNIRAKWGIADQFELGLGWNLLGFADDGFGNNTSGVGDPFAHVKLGIGPGPDDVTAVHYFAIYAYARLGIGQEDLRLGVNETQEDAEIAHYTPSQAGTEILGAFAYTVDPLDIPDFEVDAMAGFGARFTDDDSFFFIPVSGRVGYFVGEDVEVLGELAMRIDLSDLGDTSLAATPGLAYYLSPTAVLDASLTLGLSQTIPDVMVAFGMTWLGIPVGGD